MLVNKKKVKFGITDIVGVIVSVLFLVGINQWFPVCRQMGEMVMACHWAGEMLKAIAVLFVVLAVLHVFMADCRVKIGMDIAFCGIYGLALNIPGRIINICTNAEMSCKKNTEPWTIVFCVILIIVALLDVIFYEMYSSREKHKRIQKEEQKM